VGALMKLDFKEIRKETNQENTDKIDIKISNTKIVSDLLKKHYAFPIRTLVQEYLTNAKDAHKQIESKRPIEVTMPTKISPILKIRDFGSSLNPDQVKNIFAELGESTKRTSNNQSGGFGIGSKSAFAYRDNFYLRTFIDKVERLYEITKAERYEGQINLLVEKTTEQDNGLCIEIPVEVSDIDSFFNAVLRATYFWKVKPKIIAGAEQKIPKTYNKLNTLASNNNWTIIDATNDDQFNSFFNSSYIFVIDEIPYDIKENQFFSEKYENDQKLQTDINSMIKILISNRKGLIHSYPVYCIIEKNVGELDVAISREELEYSSNNKQKVKKDLQFVLEEARGKIQEKVYDIEDVSDKIVFLDKLKKFTGVNKGSVNEFYLYKNLDIVYNTFVLDKIYCQGLSFMSFSFEFNDRQQVEQIRFIGHDDISMHAKNMLIMGVPALNSRKELREMLEFAFFNNLLDKHKFKNKNIILVVPRTNKIAKQYESICCYNLNKVKDDVSFVKCFSLDKWRRKFSLSNESIVHTKLIPKQSVILYTKSNNKFQFKIGQDKITQKQLVELRDLFKLNRKQNEIFFINENDFIKKKISSTKLVTYKSIGARKEFAISLFALEINNLSFLKQILVRHNHSVIKKYKVLIPYETIPVIKNKQLISLLQENHKDLVKDCQSKIKKINSFLNKIKQDDLTLYYLITSTELESGVILYDRKLKLIFDKYLKYLK
jgi:hypothetical protein